MSIADHFEHVPDAAFIRDYDSQSARRQFRVSLVLIAVIALAATALGLIINFDSPSRHAAVADSFLSQTPSYVGKL